MEKIVVVGANHAGTAAINTILDHYEGKKVVVFDSNSNISFLGCGMALWIGKQISSGEGLFYANKEMLEKKGATIYMETEVYHIDFEKKIVYAKGVKDGKEYQETYDKLILSTGSLPIQLPVPGVELENVQFVKLYQNAKEVIEKLEVNSNIKHVTVIGAGYIGVELVEAFKRWGKEVTLVDFCEDCLSNYYDKMFRDMMDKNLADHGIELKYGQLLKEIKGDGKVERVVTDKEEFKTDMVVLCVGFRPNTKLAKEQLEIFKNGAYKVNRYQETSKKDVYAIGDCATVYDNTVDDTNYIALASNALRSGVIAAHNVCGTVLESPGVQGSNGISIYGWNMVSTGLTYEKAQRLGIKVKESTYTDLQKPEFVEHDNYPVTIRIVYHEDTRVILGAQIASKENVSMALHLFSLAIQEKVTVDKLKLLDIFFLPHFNKPYNYIMMAAMRAK